MVLQFDEEKSKTQRKRYWECKCSCLKETIFSVYEYNLTNNISKSCGCIKTENLINANPHLNYDLVGKSFGRLTVIEKAEKINRQNYWWCKCNCGNKELVKASTARLNSGRKKSCGCLRKEQLIARNKQNAKYSNDWHTRLMTIWDNMRSRVNNPNVSSYDRYGGRGIIICEEWQNDFYAFKEWAMDNGYNKVLTLDRIDVNGNYEPSNCRWSTYKDQANNTRANVMLEYNNQIKTITQWAEELNFNPKTLQRRYREGWSIEETLTTPLNQRRNNKLKGEIYE